MSQQALKFIRDRSISSSPLELVQWDADGDIAYVPFENTDWNVVPTGALQGLDELAQRVRDSSVSIEAKSANFTAAYNKIYIITGAVTVTLPAPAASGSIVLKKIGASTVTVARNGAEKIEDIAASYLLTSDKQAVTLVSNTTDWFII